MRTPWWIGPLSYSLLACALAWVTAIPLWLWGRSADATTLIITQVTAMAMMFTPVIAALIVVRFVHRVPWAAIWPRLGIYRFKLRYGYCLPPRPLRRWFAALGLALGITIVLVVISVVLSVPLGGLTLGTDGFAAQAGVAESGIPPTVLLVISVVSIPFAAIVPNALLAAGEEIGWRGYLFPQLMRLGWIPAVVLSGAVWGVWHAPLLLRGFNYELTDARSLLMMMIACIVIGAWLCWLTAYSGSVWPAAVAHGALNAAGGLGVLFSRADAPINPVLLGPMGVAGWIVFGAVAVVVTVFIRRRGVPTWQTPAGSQRG